MFLYDFLHDCPCQNIRFLSFLFVAITDGQICVSTSTTRVNSIVDVSYCKMLSGEIVDRFIDDISKRNLWNENKLQFHWILFLRNLLKLYQHWLRYWLCNEAETKRWPFRREHFHTHFLGVECESIDWYCTEISIGLDNGLVRNSRLDMI